MQPLPREDVTVRADVVLRGRLDRTIVLHLPFFSLGCGCCKLNSSAATAAAAAGTGHYSAKSNDATHFVQTDASPPIKENILHIPILVSDLNFVIILFFNWLRDSK